MKMDIEWALVRIKKDGSSDLLSPGSKGAPKDKAQCIFCEATFSAQLERIRAHHTHAPGHGIKVFCSGCKPRPDETEAQLQLRREQFTAARAKCQEIQDEKDQKRDRDAELDLLDIATGGAGKKAKKQRKIMFEPTGTNSRQQLADQAVARAVYASGIAPHVMEHPEWQMALKKVAEVGPAYRPIERKEISGPLLIAERGRLEARVKLRRQVVAKRTGTTIVSDGATDIAKRPVLNLLECCAGSVEYVKAIDCTGVVKDKQMIANFVCDYVESLDDPYSVVQVLMDNACRGSWPIIEERCNWITCGPCIPHVGDLEIGDICKLPRCKAHIQRAASIRNFIRDHSHVYAALKSLDCKLLTKPAPTRMAGVMYGLDVMQTIKKEICVCLASDEVVDYIRRSGNNKVTVDGSKVKLKDVYLQVKRDADDMDFWDQNGIWISIFMPITGKIRLGDSDAPTASKMQYTEYAVQEKLKKATDALDDGPLQQEIISIHYYRWDYGYTILQGTGYLLDPEFWDMDQDKDEITMQSFRDFVDKTFPFPKDPPVDATAEARQVCKALRKGQLLKRAAAEEQLATYRTKAGLFGRETVGVNARKMSMVDFWIMYGSGVPELQQVALRSCQVSGAGAAERGHKNMNHILDKKRNKTGFDRLEDLMYVRQNLQLLRQTQSVKYSGPRVIDWTEVVDAHTSWVDAWQPEVDAMIDGAADEAQLQQRKRGAQRSANISKTASSRVKPTVDVEEQSEVDALNTELDNAANEGRPARTRSGRMVVRPAELDFFIAQR